MSRTRLRRPWRSLADTSSKRGQGPLRRLRDGQGTLSSVGALGRVGNAHARDGLEGVAIIQVPSIKPRVKRKLEPSRSRDPKIIQEGLHLRGTMTRHTGGA